MSDDIAVIDELARQIEANISQAGVNSDAIEAKLALVKASRWRLARNRRLLVDCWRLMDKNDRLVRENGRLLARRQQRIDAYRA